MNTSITSKWSSTFWKQCFVVTGASLNLVSCGFTMAFTPAFLYQLKESSTNITEDQYSWLASITGISEIFGIVIASIMMDYFGRRRAILFGTTNMVAGWMCLIISTTYSMLMFARFLQGLSMGFTSVLSAVMIGEYASPKNRGSFLATISFSISTGSLAAHSLGFILSWKTTAAICASVAIVNLVIIFLSPESPSYLAAHGKFEECNRAFHWLRGLDEEEELEKLTKRSMAKIEPSDQPRQNKNLLMKMKDRYEYIKHVIRKKEFYVPLFLMVHLQLINAWNGCTLFDAYAIDVVQNIVGNDLDLSITVQSIDVLKLLLNVLSIVITKKIKRRSILLITVPLNISTYFIIAGYTYWKSCQTLPWDHPYIGVSLLYLHMFSVAMGCIPLPNIIAGEIFCLEYKGVSSLISSIFFSLYLFVNLKTAPELFSSVTFSGTFCMYSCIMIYAFVVLVFYLPETKDMILQDIEDEFISNRSSQEIHTEYNQIEALMSGRETYYNIPYKNTEIHH